MLLDILNKIRPGKSRFVLVHNHIFKNAGSSIDWALKKNFGDNFLDHRDDDLMRRGAAYLGPYLENQKNIRALSTHHLTLPLPDISKVNILQIMMFRHPIERVTSVYSFERKQIEATTPGAIHAQKFNLNDYILWRMRPDVGATIRNFHVLKSLPPKIQRLEAYTSEDVSSAKRYLKSIKLLGLVEKFDESMVLFEHVVGRLGRNIDLSYVKQNVNQDYLGLNREERINNLRSQIDDYTFNLLVANNEQDLELYAWVEREFMARIKSIPDFNNRLDAFRKRCISNETSNHAD